MQDEIISTPQTRSLRVRPRPFLDERLDAKARDVFVLLLAASIKGYDPTTTELAESLGTDTDRVDQALDLLVSTSHVEIWSGGRYVLHGVL